MYLPKIIAIVGPTASGKSALAVRLAKKFDGEVVSADSRQVYRGLDIGSGKIKEKEMGGITHHLLDVASPRRQFNVAQYKTLADRKIKEILGRGRLPIICGGTGFYVDVLCKGMVLPPVPPNPRLRTALAKKNVKELLARIRELDPTYAGKVEKNNPRRLIRAIEIATALGRVPKIKTAPLPYPVLKIGIRLPSQILRRKIRQRLQKRFGQGLIAEVQKLHRQGISWQRLENFGLEYRYVTRFLREELSNIQGAPESARRRIRRKKIANLRAELARAIWLYAKRQITWFKRDPEIRWCQSYRQAEKLASSFLAAL